MGKLMGYLEKQRPIFPRTGGAGATQGRKSRQALPRLRGGHLLHIPEPRHCTVYERFPVERAGERIVGFSLSGRPAKEQGGFKKNNMCYCHTCERYFNYLGINSHRAYHRRRRENCTITYTKGDTYTFHYADITTEEKSNIETDKHGLTETDYYIGKLH